MIEVERSKPGLIAVVDVIEGGTDCEDCATPLLVTGISPGDDIEES